VRPEHWIYTIPLRLRSLFRWAQADQELDDELRDHLERKTEEYVAQGMTQEEAQRRARIDLDGIEQTKEKCRDTRKVNWIQDFVQDLRFGLRVLRKSPGFTAVVILTLALGIGANTAIFSVLESQLWRSLPFPDSERLVDAHLVMRENHTHWDVLPYRGYQAWRTASHSFVSLSAFDYPSNRNLTAGGTSERVEVMPVSPTLFETLQVPLEQGRTFLPDEEVPGNDHVAILTHALWQSRFASDAAILGKTMTIDGAAYTVVGIASARLRFEYHLHEPAIFVPLSMDPYQQAPLRNTYVIARLAPGVTRERARAELSSLVDPIMKAEGRASESVAEVTNLRETWTDFAARPLYFFAGAVLLVLLIACVNNSGLLLARGLSRQREFTLRATLGAGRTALVRQSLAESLLLALAGGTIGVLLGIWGAQAFAAFMPEDTLPRKTEIVLDARVLLFCVGVSLFSALVMGLMPALLASRVDLNYALRQSAAGVSASRSQHKTRSTLVIVEVAIGLVLLFGAGLFLSSFVREERAPRGFNAPGALTFRVSLRGENYAKPEQQQRYFDSLLEQLRLLPGNREVTLGSGLPLTGSTGVSGTVNVAGRPPTHKYGTYVTIHAVAPNYFRALGMRLLTGRPFDSHDDPASTNVAILNRNAATELFGAEDPLGKVLDFVAQPHRGVPAQPSVQIVGVVENAQEFGANEVPQVGLYVPFTQRPLPSAYVLVSSDVPRGALLGPIRDAAYSLDKDQPIFDIKTMDDRIADSVRSARFDLILVACLAAVALALVSVGILGTVAHFVQQRTQEFGIRIALGASPAHVLRQAIGRAYAMGIAGLVFGVALALAIGRILGSALYLVPHEHSGMLYGVKIYDPLSMVVASVVLLAVLFLASFFPARRAMRVDPMVALRYE